MSKYVEVQLDVVCDECGGVLTWEADDRYMPVEVSVEACEKCLARARDEWAGERSDRAYDDGYIRGYEEGYAVAREEFEHAPQTEEDAS